MSAPYTVSKGLTSAQMEAFIAATKRAGLTPTQAREEIFRLFCATHGIKWPPTQPHGGKRQKRGSNESR